jgi:hypothetical protein
MYSQELYQLYWSPDIIRTKYIYQASLHINNPREDLNLGGNMMYRMIKERWALLIGEK